MNAEVIFEGGRIFRGLEKGFATAMAIGGGRVLALDDEALALAGPETRRVDLAGRCAIPAFHEAHMHLLAFGLGLSQVNLRAEQVTTLAELQSRIRAAATTPGEWVLGRGYDHAALDINRHPSMAELDAAAPNNPVFITRTCGHMGVANSAALRAAGIGHNTPDPDGGVIERREGVLTGLIQERALSLIKAAMPAPAPERLVDAIDAAGRHLASLGFASASDMNLGMNAGMAEIAAYREAEAQGRLHQRMWLVLAANPDGIEREAWAAGIRPMTDPAPMLRFGGAKVFADGSAGGLTAAFMEPYRQGGTGQMIFSDEQMQTMLAALHEAGWQLDIHAIGDAAIEQVLHAMELAGATPAHRHRIEHCGFPNRHQRRRMLACGIIPVPQPIFLYEFGDLYVDNLGAARAAASYPMRTWMEEGAHPSASSDAPVSTPDPFLNLFTMVTRQTRRGTVLGADETLTIEQAVHAYTWCGAYSNFAEGARGTLEPGMDADIAVLSRDIFDGPPEALCDTRCDLTFRGGTIIHGNT
jgi:predicted amidohydrolase YtcJ